MARKLAEGRKMKKKKPKVTPADVIRTDIVHLCENTTELSGITLRLHSAGVISEAERQDIMTMKTDFDKSSQLYTLVSKKGEGPIRTLLAALNETGNQDLCSRLTEKLALQEDEEESDDTDGDDDGRRQLNVQSQPADLETQDGLSRRRVPDHRKERMKTVGCWTIAILALFMLFMFGARIFYSSTERPRNSSSNSSSNNDLANSATVPNGPNPVTAIPEDGDKSETERTWRPDIPSNSSSNEDEDYNRFESSELRFLHYTINTPVTSLPSNLPLPTTRLNVTITSTIKYDWRHWEIVNSLKIYTLSLKGCFNESDVHYFLKGMKNLRVLNISRGTYLCEEFTGQTDENGIVRFDHGKLEQLHIYILPECDLLYKYLAELVHFHNLKYVTLNGSYVTFANIHLINMFFSNHEKSLVVIYVNNMTLCEGCELFKDDLVFDHLEIATFNFLTFKSTAAVKTVRNFSRASSLLHKFYSNISCDVVDTRIFEKNWKHLDYQGSQLCQEKESQENTSEESILNTQ